MPHATNQHARPDIMHSSADADAPAHLGKVRIGGDDQADPQAGAAGQSQRLHARKRP
jgi:hypothetical protein